MSEGQLELDLEFDDQVVSNQVTQFRVLTKVLKERLRQDKKWGEQNHPYFSYFGGMNRTTNRLYEGLEATYKWKNEVAVSDRGELGWDTILLEEVFEALAKAGVDDVEYEKELVEVMAVALAMIEANRRKRGRTQASQ